MNFLMNEKLQIKKRKEEEKNLMNLLGQVRVVSTNQNFKMS